MGLLNVLKYLRYSHFFSLVWLKFQKMLDPTFPMMLLVSYYKQQPQDQVWLFRYLKIFEISWLLIPSMLDPMLPIMHLGCVILLPHRPNCPGLGWGLGFGFGVQFKWWFMVLSSKRLWHKTYWSIFRTICHHSKHCWSFNLHPNPRRLGLGFRWVLCDSIVRDP